MGKRLEGKAALITGGNTGIGRAVALAFAAEGADVAIGWIAQADAAERLVQELRAAGRRAQAYQADVTDERAVVDLMRTVVSAFGRIDVLVNNAGIQRAQPLTEMSAADWDAMMAVHLRGTFLCTREAAKHMIPRQQGSIINVCSQLGYIGRANYAAYSAAKGGVIAFTRAVAKELAPHGVLVNGVSPGLIDTGFDPLTDAAKAQHAAALPLGRLGLTADVTSSFVFLASDEARYFCGQILHPNGGEIMP
ncbi:MAG: SDR family NAD(P)-dependent oxidoreductase [Burkholderiales bacterium]